MTKASEKDIFDFLNSELGRLYAGLNGHQQLLLRFLIAADVVSVGLIVWVSSVIPASDRQFQIILIFFAPLVILSLLGAGLLLIHQMGFHLHMIRKISHEIRTAYDTNFISYHDKDSFPSSIQSGDTTFALLWNGFIAIPMVLLLGLIGLSFSALYQVDHWLAVVFLAFYVIGIVYIGAGVAGAVADLPKLHEEFPDRKVPSAKNTFAEINRQAQSRITRFFFARPASFFTNGFLLFIGTGLALLENKNSWMIQGDIQKFRETVFSAPYPANSFVIFTFLFAWFFIQEILIQQAKYIWNDIRDQKSNKIIAANKTRPLAVSSIGRRTYVELFARWIPGLVLAFILSRALFTMVIIISTLQVLYEFIGKPNSGKYPVLPLFIGSAGAISRFISGAYAVNWGLVDARSWFYALIFFSLGTTSLATMWRIEALYMSERKQGSARGQSDYFLRSGRAWTIVGWVYSCLLMIMIHVNQLTNWGDMALVALKHPPLPANMALTVISAMVLYGISYGIAVPLIKILHLLKSSYVKKLFVVACLIFGLGVTARAAIAGWLTDRFVIIICLVVAASFLKFWNIGYEEYTLMHLLKNFSIFKKALGLFIFSAEGNIRWFHLLWMVFNLNSGEFESRLNAYEVPKEDQFGRRRHRSDAEW